MMNKGGDRIEHGKLFDAFLGSSAIWQPPPCREINVSNAAKPQDDFADENINVSSNIIANPTRYSGQKSGNKLDIPLGNSFGIAAPPFYSSKFAIEQISTTNQLLTESLKRTRSGNAANLNRGNETGELWKPPFMETRSQPNLPKETGGDKWTEMLPDNIDFEDAILAAVLGSSNEFGKDYAGKIHRKIEKRLKVLQDIVQGPD